MSVFKAEVETKRVIFNVRLDLAERLEKAKEDARIIGKKLDHEGVIDKALEKFLRKAERKLDEIKTDDEKAPRNHIKPQKACEDDTKHMDDPSCNQNTEQQESPDQG